MGNDENNESIKNFGENVLNEIKIFGYKAKEFFEDKINKIKNLRANINKNPRYYDFSVPNSIQNNQNNYPSGYQEMNNLQNNQNNWQIQGQIKHNNININFGNNINNHAFNINFNNNNNFHNNNNNINFNHKNNFINNNYNNNNFINSYSNKNNNNYYNKNNNININKNLNQNNNININKNLNQNNFNKNIKKQQNFEQPSHLRGLVNIANTCYMNSIIQCFAHIIELFEYFQKPKFIELTKAANKDQKLFPVFSELINLMWIPSDPSPLYPRIFKERLGQMNELFRGPIPNDAKDLLTFILMQLHEELNKPKNNNTNMNQNIIPSIEMQKNKTLMLKYFAEFFIANYRSIISELFYGLNYNETQCILCGTALYNYQTFNFLIFPLFEVLNYKIKSINFQTNFNSTVTLEDCFDYNQSHMILNEYYCNACRRNSKGRYTNFLSALPNIIIIILNRGVGLQYKVKIDFDENIDLRKYVDNFKDNSFYELIGVVTHYGESGANGHFMARCKSPLDNFWYLYNDAIVQKIGYFTKEKFLQGNPYILFYKRANIKK